MIGRKPGPPGLKMPLNLDAHLDGAACLPWTGSHDSRHPGELPREFGARFTAARETCRTCPVLAECDAQRDYYIRHRVRLDGIFAGRHYEHGGGA